MTPLDFFNALVSAHGSRESVTKLPGAFVRDQVIGNTIVLRTMLDRLQSLSAEDQASFIKSLALYEQTIGGLGSPTLLVHAFPLIDDPDHQTFDWVLTNTTSYEYYARGATSFAEFESRERHDRARAAENLVHERQGAEAALLRRAEKANSNLFNAIRRGDFKAVEALLRQGARSDLLSSEGTLAADYADKAGFREIARLLRDWQDTCE